MLSPNKKDCSVVPKGWGHELHIENNLEYCAKLLVFRSGGKSSMHYHIDKLETWYVQEGAFKLRWINPKTAETTEELLTQGDAVTIPRGLCHQLEATEDGVIFESSTRDLSDDSYRTHKGDGQN